MSELTIQTLTNTDISQRGLSLIENNTYVGIDFGTSTSIVSIISIRDGDIITKAIPIKQDTRHSTFIEERIIPTVIAIFNNRVLVGKGAEELKFDLKKDKNVFFNFKMDLGEQHYFTASIFNKIKSPKDATSIFIRFLKSKITGYCRENGLSENISYSFSIPASFESNQRSEFVEALKENDINVTQSVLIDEPNAAFISYLKYRFQNGEPLILPRNANLNYLVFDFGAGTCDVSLIEVGNSFEGIFSKNLAISKFEKIGGRNIDEVIAREIILDQFLDENDLDRNDFAGFEIENIILPRLLKTSENLKIELCERVAIQFSQDDFELPARASSEDSITLQPNVIISTTRGEFTLRRATLSFRDFKNVLTPLLEETPDGNSIFNPIYDVVGKANINKDDVFAVLFIGGSSKNPYVQNSIAQFFDRSEKLVPQDLQTHVSEGTAINSLFINGFNRTILRQITSNTILLDTKDGKIPLVRSGIEIPSQENVLDTGIMTWREGQDIRLPIYNKSNILLYEVYLEHPSGNGFSQNTSVEIKYNIDVNKNLVVFASADGQEVDVKIQNPFYTGSSLTPVQRRIRRLEGQWHSEKDTGIVSETTYKELTQAYKEDGQFLLAAKLMVEAKKIHPRIFSYNDIGLAFSRANDSGEACHYYRKALEEMPTSATIMFNLSYQLRKDDPEKERLLQEALRNDPEHAPSLIEYAKLIKHKDEEKADEFQLNAFNVLNKQYESNSLPEWGKSWLRSSALATGHLDTVRKINEEESNAPNNLLDDRVIVKGDIIKL